MSEIINRNCPLCEQHVPRDVPHIELRMGTETRPIHKDSCARKVSEMYMTSMLGEVRQDKKRKKRKEKRRKAQQETPADED